MEHPPGSAALRTATFLEQLRPLWVVLADNDHLCFSKFQSGPSSIEIVAVASPQLQWGLTQLEQYHFKN